MAVARPHPQQQDRLTALRSFEILDTDREKEFDEIVQLAAEICATNISVINFIDTDRQWFKAETGLGVRETPLETSLCSHAILEAEFLEINDTQLDPRMADNPLCQGDAALRFYAGALLNTDEGLPLGTLCVLHDKPMALTPLQRDTLRVLSRQVMARLEMRKALNHAVLLRQEVDHRVKNSLQSLSSLVRLAMRNAESDETQKALSTMQSRIGAVAMLHEELYRTDAGPVIDLGRYVGNLGRHFTEIAPEKVTVEIECHPVKVSSNQAAAVGTLVNEFVANSFKHAFPDGRAGTVRVTVGNAPNNKIKIACSDSGVGLPDTSERSLGGLGMQIAGVISAELQGELVVDSGAEGLTISLEFEALTP